ncbi:hypothetical protein U1Q18_004849 [Sarracenia purpurea var. burkii]
MWSVVLPLAHCPQNRVLTTQKTTAADIYSDGIASNNGPIGDGYRFHKFVTGGAKFKPAICVNFSSTSHGPFSGAGGEHVPRELQESQNQQQNKGFWKKWRENSAEMSSKLGKLGLSAVLAYGLFDGVTYTTFFVLAFLGYEKSTGKNPAANLQALLGIVILMWTGNNVTRPFRVAGAAALAPVIDKGLKRIQEYFNFPSLVYAFALVVGIVATLCLTVVGLLILSRWGK